MELTTEKIDSDAAKTMLAKMAPNRKLSSDIAVRYATEMEAGRWKFAGDPIRFDPDGFLIDGQHRLQAVILAGAALDFVVVRGVERTAMAVVDTGKRRSLSDVMHMRGEKNTTALAAAVNAHYAFAQGNEFRSKSVNVSYELGLRHLSENPDIREAVLLASRMRHAVDGPNSLYAALLYEMRLLSDLDAEVFVERLVSGAGLEATDPIFRLREMLLQQRSSPKKYHQRYLAALIIKAWNAYRDGASMKQLIFRSGGASPEAFPTIR